MLRRILGVVAVSALIAGTTQAVEVYDSASNDAANTGTRPMLADDSTVTLNVYVDNPAGAIASAVGTECSGTGAGDEYCGVDLLISATGLLEIDSFTPDPGADIVSNVSTASARFNFGDPINGNLGPKRVATIDVSATGAGTLEVSSGLWVGSALTANGIANPTAVIADSGCADTDSDTICFALDPCPSFVNTVVPVPGEIPGECLCGDANENGVHEFSDAFVIIGCANLTGDPVFCAANAGRLDANGNGVAEFSDAFEVIGQANLTAVVPPSSLTCGVRPEGTPPP